MTNGITHDESESIAQFISAVSKIDFNTPKMNKEFEEIEKQNEEIIRQSKVDVENIRFTI